MEVHVRNLSLLLLCSVFLLLACGKSDKGSSGPSFSSLQLMDAQSETRFDSLPLEGEVDLANKFWSGDHWPLNKGGINRRWSGADEGFDLVSPTKEEVGQLSAEEIARLSPAEKYDLLMGKYDYPLKTEVAGRANRSALDWEGLGNGWALASVGHAEPAPKTLANPDGISVQFGSSDIKALLTYFYAMNYNAPSQQLGLRCFERMGWNDNKFECKDDLDAGSFHVVLSNRIGVNKQSIFADLDRYDEVWNHPIVGYKSEIEEAKPDANTPAGVARVVYAKTTISYVNKNRAHSWDPIGARAVATRLYTYHLYLNGEGLVVGGRWKSSDRPDFLWSMGTTDSFSGYLQGLDMLLQ